MHGMAWQGKARHAGGLENISVGWVFKSMAGIGIGYIYIYIYFLNFIIIIYLFSESKI